MKFARLFYLYCITLCIYDAFSYNINSFKMFQTSDYLNKLNKHQNKNKIYKNIGNNTKILYDSSIYLDSLQNKNSLKHNIYKLLLNESNVLNNTNETKKYKFNTLYFNIRKIEKIFIDKKFTKIILNIRNDNEKKVFYVNDDNELEQINSLIQLIPNTISKLIISDIIDDILGYIYHDMINRQ